MSDCATPESAELVVLHGLHPDNIGVFLQVYLFRRLRCVHVYQCFSRAREWWYQLFLSTDYRYALTELSQNKNERQVMTSQINTF
jgi:hypothetical protein